MSTFFQFYECEYKMQIRDSHLTFTLWTQKIFAFKAIWDREDVGEKERDCGLE